MTSHDNSVIISEADNLDSSSAELVSADGIGQHEPVQQHQDVDTSGMSYATVHPTFVRNKFVLVP